VTIPAPHPSTQPSGYECERFLAHSLTVTSVSEEDRSLVYIRRWVRCAVVQKDLTLGPFLFVPLRFPSVFVMSVGKTPIHPGILSCRYRVGANMLITPGTFVVPIRNQTLHSRVSQGTPVTFRSDEILNANDLQVLYKCKCSTSTAAYELCRP